MELILPTVFHHIFICAYPGSFQCLGTDLFVLVAQQMDTERESIDGGLLSSHIVYPYLGIWDPSAVTGLRVGFVLTISIAASRSSAHYAIYRTGTKYGTMI